MEYTVALCFKFKNEKEFREKDGDFGGGETFFYFKNGQKLLRDDGEGGDGVVTNRD